MKAVGTNQLNYNIVNSNVATINAEINKETTARLSAKKGGGIVERPVPSERAEFYYDNSEVIANVVDIRKADIVKTNDIGIVLDDGYEPTEQTIFLETILNQNKEEYADIVADETLYGAGAGTILVVDDETVFIDHIPNKLLDIELYKHTDNVEYPVVVIKDYSNKKTGYGVLFNWFYPEDFPLEYNGFDLELIFWLGGGQFNDFYSKPFYLQFLQELNSRIAVRELDTKTFNSGNQLSGIVVISKSGQAQLEVNGFDDYELDEEFLELSDNPNNEKNNENGTFSQVLPQNVEILKDQISKAGFANAIYYEETDDPLNVNYINLTNNNQDYILKKFKSLKDEMYERAKIPKERIMNSENRDSLGSQKTVSMWKIYLNNINSQQQGLEELLSKLIWFAYELDYQFEIGVPEFEDFKIAKAQMYRDIGNDGYMTPRNVITVLNKIYPEIWLPENDHWALDEYLVKGQPLGTSNNQQSVDSLVEGVANDITKRINTE